MGGAGGGGPFIHRSPEQMAELIRKTEQEQSIKAFENELNGLLGELLSNANSRDVEGISDRLEEIKDALGENLDDTIDSLFGGSVAKHTYVDGLSDVDSLLILNGTEMEGQKPSQAVAKLEAMIKAAVGESAEVSSG